MAERKAVVRQMAPRYARAPKAEKGRILDELCALTGWARRHARRALARALEGPTGGARRPRPRIYGEEVLEPLRFIWASLDGPSGKRLAPFMAEVVEALERHGELELDPEVRAKLLRMSSPTIDRALAPDRRRLGVKGRSGTTPGSGLRRQIPIRTFAEWDEARPGFCEADLVAHDGGSPHREFCQTLDLTCVATGWTEPRGPPQQGPALPPRGHRRDPAGPPVPPARPGLRGRGGVHQHAALPVLRRAGDHLHAQPPLPEERQLLRGAEELASGPPAGRLRPLRDPAELEALRDLYRVLRLYVNFFQPQMKLVSKTRRGAKVTKRFDTARTPYQRVLESPYVTEGAKRRLREIYLALNPAQLKRDLAACQARLLEVSRRKSRDGKEAKRPPGPRPGVYSKAEASRTSFVMQPELASRTS